MTPFAPQYRTATAGIVTQVTLVAFEAMAVSTAMPVAAGALGGLREYGLAFSLFLTTSLLGIVAAGGWADGRGAREPLAAGLVLFAGGLVVSGTASTFGALLVGRAVSGLGGGLLIVTLYVVVAAVYPADLVPRVFGVVSAAWVLPGVLGPPVAGFLATHVSWRSVFLLVPPLALLPLPVLWSRLTRLQHERAASAPDGVPAPSPDHLPDAVPAAGDAAAPEAAPVPDAASAPDGGREPRPDAVEPRPGLVRDLTTGRRVLHGLALAVGAVLVQWGFQGAGPLPAAPVAVAGAALAAAGTPGLLPRGFFRLRRGLASLVACRGLYTGTFFGAETFVPLMLVTHRGLSPTMAGIALTGGALGWSVGSFTQGRGLLPLPRTGLLSVGGAVVALSILGLVPAPGVGVPTWLVPVVWTVGGIGMGLAMASTSVLTLRLSVPGEEGRNSAALQIGDALGSVLGIGTAGAIFAAMHSSGAGPADDGRVFSVIWLVLGLAATTTVVLGLRVANVTGKPFARSGSAPAQ